MEQKRLMRSRKNRMIAGVCAGIAEYMHEDPTLIRLLFLVGAFLSGAGLIVYLVLWVVMPEAPVELSSTLSSTLPPPPPAPPQFSSTLPPPPPAPPAPPAPTDQNKG